MATNESDDDETLAELFGDRWDLTGQLAATAGREDIERRWQEWLQLCATPPSAAERRVRIIVDVDLGDPNISTTLTVQPQVPLMSVATTLRILVEAIETGQINSLQLPKETP